MSYEIKFISMILQFCNLIIINIINARYYSYNKISKVSMMRNFEFVYTGRFDCEPHSLRSILFWNSGKVRLDIVKILGIDLCNDLRGK